MDNIFCQKRSYQIQKQKIIIVSNDCCKYLLDLFSPSSNLNYIKTSSVSTAAKMISEEFKSNYLGEPWTSDN